MEPQLIDAHAHVNFSAFDADREETVKRALDAGIWLINVGTQQDTSKSAVELAEKYDEGVYAIVGLHPVHTDKSYHDQAELGEGSQSFTSRGEIFDATYYEKLANHPKVVGIGECGLDYFRLEEGSEAKQRESFSAQIALANSVGKPLMLHIRSSEGKTSAYTDVLAMLRSEDKVKGNVHFFAGTVDEAKAFLDLGFFISFTGVITFAKEYEELVRFVPLDRIIVETDCPYVAPVPYRGRRNEPLFVAEVAKKVAEIKSRSFLEVAAATCANTRRLFGF